MLIETKIKDSLLLGVLYLMTALACLYGWLYLDMKWEFLSAPLIFALIWGIVFVKEVIYVLIISLLAIIAVSLIVPIFISALIEWGFHESTSGAIFICSIQIGFFFLLSVILKIVMAIKERMAYLKHFEKKIYPELIRSPNPHIRLSLFMLIPPFTSFFSLYLARSTGYLSSWFPCVLTGIVIIFLSLIFMSAYQRFLLHFHYASQYEKKIWPYVFFHPRIFCKKHLMRPRKLRKALFYYDVRCRAKDESHEFIRGIREIVGLIGSNADEFERDRDRLYINLWSESHKKAINADIDVLEIRDTEGISYDYAINAVLVTLKNDASRPGEYVRQIPVIIRGNPLIPEGAMRILGHEFGKIRKKVKTSQV
ncbi:hypothetical protein QUF80_18870 [Desulfococcaceae bacterium HSG8]|nr:hypothetical protein [Desulfococcaceae bacterium HSG8]